MHLDYLPLLRIQRELYSLPRGMERFREYLKALQNDARDDLELPLVGMNPMAKEHVPALLDAYLALDADAIAARAVAGAQAEGEGSYRVALVLHDDAKGGWTNRWTTEFSLRFETGAMRKRGWIVAPLWSSEEPSAAAVESAVLVAIHRTSFIVRNGEATTLRARMQQEGEALRRAGARVTLDAEELAYTREVLARHLDSSSMPTTVAALFGDHAADSLSFPRLGLSPNAGLELAMMEAV